MASEQRGLRPQTMYVQIPESNYGTEDCEETMKIRLIMPESNDGAEDLKMTSPRPIDF